MGYNIQRRVNIRGGWIGLFSGESMGSAIERILRRLNEDGYRVTFMVRDEWSFFRHVLNVIVTIGTVGILSHQQGYVIIGEKIADAKLDTAGASL